MAENPEKAAAAAKREVVRAGMVKLEGGPGTVHVRMKTLKYGSGASAVQRLKIEP